jgi:hypothetical protein
MSHQLRIVQRGNPLFFHEFHWTKGRRICNETDVSAPHDEAKEHSWLSGSNEDKERKTGLGQQTCKRPLEAYGQRRAIIIYT